MKHWISSGWLLLGAELWLAACSRSGRTEKPANPTSAAQAAESSAALTLVHAVDAPEKRLAAARAAAESATPCAPLELPSGAGTLTRFAVIGDFGQASMPEAAVARWVLEQQPEFVITTGDNNYPRGERATIDENIGQYYSSLICPYVGRFGAGSKENRFFPALGNHDWMASGAKPYLEYFTLPNNERYYEVRLGNIHLFVVDSDPQEPDGVTADSVQGVWFASRVKSSDAPFKIFAFHHAPFTTGHHGSTIELRWPFDTWGVDLVLAGHDHHYERSSHDGVTHVVNGLGGRSLYPVAAANDEKHVAFNAEFGAQVIEATDTRLTSKFVALSGKVVDEFTLTSRRVAKSAASTGVKSAPSTAPALQRSNGK